MYHIHTPLIGIYNPRYVVYKPYVLLLLLLSMLYLCVRDVMDVVFSVCIVTHGAACARTWEVFRHADVVCLCLVCILWQLSMLHSE